MKITETLESLLRLLVTTHSDRDGRTGAKPVAEWVARTNAVLERARATEPVAFTRPASVGEPATAADPAESLEPEPEPDPKPEDELDAAGVPGLLDSLISWVQSEPEHEPEPSVRLTPPEPEPTELPFEPEPVERETGAEASLVPVDHDLAHLETAANVAESLNLGFHLGAAVERIASASTQGSQGVPALREAAWLIERYIAIIEKRPLGADLHRSAARLARAGDAIAGLKALAETLDDASGHDLPGRIRRLSPEQPPPAA